jgi:cell wall-associated NlpC family hydrolase
MLRRLTVLAALAGTLFAGQVIVSPQKAEAAAINYSDAKEHAIRVRARDYALIQVQQREPYCWGGTGPDCFDCSGLIVGAYRYAAINLPARGVRSSRDFYRWTTRISLAYARAGDVLIYDTDGNGTVNHIEMFYKRGYAISATYSGGPPVNIHPIRTRGLVKVGQVVT